MAKQRNYKVQTTGEFGGWVSVGKGKGVERRFRKKSTATKFAKQKLGKYGIKTRIIEVKALNKRKK